MDIKEQRFEHISETLARALSQELITYGNKTEPPYDSPIETIFAETCFKHLNPSVNTDKQAKIVTKHGYFLLDFLLSLNDTKVGIECDGAQLHESLHDELRDAIIVGEGHVNTIYHFRGSDITNYPDDCVWLMSILDPGLFSERGRVQLERLHKIELDHTQDLASCDNFMCQIRDEARVYHFWAFRTSAKMISAFPWIHYHWKVLYDFACEHPGMNVDALLRERKSGWKAPR